MNYGEAALNKSILFGIFIGVVLLGPSSRADFDLPILNRVPKVISVADDFPLKQLSRFKEVSDLTLELRMTRGNLIPDWLLSFLQKNFPAVPKRIVLYEALRPAHVEKLRKLNKLEVRLETATAGLDRQTVNSLYELGPVRKCVVLGQNFSRESFDLLKKLKHFAIAIRTVKPLDKQRLRWLHEIKHYPKVFLLPPDFAPQRIYDLITLRPLKIEAWTSNNLIDDKLLAVFKDLARVELTLVVDGRLTLRDVKIFSRLDRFSLKIELDQKTRMIPGLVRLLNRIAPPR